MSEPREQYVQRLQERRAERADNARRRFRTGIARLAAFHGGLVLIYLLFSAEIAAGWLLAPLALFVALGARLTSLERDDARLGRAEDYYRRGLERLDGRWVGNGVRGTRFLDDEHLYAADLDLFGEGSLFELLCQARTRIGKSTLARWLLAPAAPATVSERQAAVRELSPRLNLREDLAVLAETARAGVHAGRLAAWGEKPPTLETDGFRLVARALTIVGVATVALAIFALGAWLTAVIEGNLSYAAWYGAPVRAVLVAAVLLFAAVKWHFKDRVEAIFLEAEEAAGDVGLLAGAIERLERETFAAPLLARLRADLDTDGQPPSRRIGRLQRLVDFVYQRDNLLVRLLGPFLLWDLNLAYALEDWRAASGDGMRRWLAAVGEIEALSSIAGYHYEQPGLSFPAVVANEDTPVFEATQLTHPLLPAERAVSNDVAIGGRSAAVWVVSGSNMSGKSTLLRTVGVAAVLAQAGAPVRAERLRLSALRVGASIRVSDSIQEGESRFYAEILKLRAIVAAAAEDPPVLFLIDEFLHGTNSHDRRIGASAIVRGLVERGAVGLVTTHDLALTHIADEVGEHGANVHFEDHLEEGVMTFDYRLRPGVVEKSNALELMRSVGLDV